jgi:hypothetical protein
LNIASSLKAALLEQLLDRCLGRRHLGYGTRPHDELVSRRQPG